MDEETAKKLHKKAIISATKYGFGRLAEDIAQEVLCRYSAGKNQHQTVDQSVIDIIREEHGRPSDPGFAARRALLIPNDPNSFKETITQRSVRIEQENGNEFHRLVEMLSGNERIVICLIFLWGLDLQEIGYCFGVDGSRISQIKSAAQKRLRRILERETNSK